MLDGLVRPAHCGHADKHGRSSWGGTLPDFRIVIVVLALFLIRAGAFKNDTITDNAWRQGIGLALFVAGLGFAIWARLYIGRNWGAPMSQKDDPEPRADRPVPPGPSSDLFGHPPGLCRHRRRGQLVLVARRGAVGGRSSSQRGDRGSAVRRDRLPGFVPPTTSTRRRCSCPSRPELGDRLDGRHTLVGDAAQPMTPGDVLRVLESRQREPAMRGPRRAPASAAPPATPGAGRGRTPRPDPPSLTRRG